MISSTLRRAIRAVSSRLRRRRCTGALTGMKGVFSTMIQPLRRGVKSDNLFYRKTLADAASEILFFAAQKGMMAEGGTIMTINKKQSVLFGAGTLGVSLAALLAGSA